MNRMIKSAVTLILVGALSVVPAFALESMTGAAEPRAAEGVPENCTNRTLSGQYGFIVQGTQFDQQPPVQAVTVGVAKFDGQGTLSGSDVASFSGQIVPRTISGTYAVNSNCTASVTITILTGFPVGATFHFSAVILNRGENMLLIQTDPGSQFTGSATKQ